LEAGRRGFEFSDLTIGDVTDHDHGLQVTVDGKQGRRTVLLIPSVPYVRDWLDEHPAPTRYSVPDCETTRNRSSAPVARPTSASTVRYCVRARSVRESIRSFSVGFYVGHSCCLPTARSGVGAPGHFSEKKRPEERICLYRMLQRKQ